MDNENQKPALLQNVIIGVIVLVAGYKYWDFAKGLLIFAFTLGILVAVHEWGHFIAGRVSGVRIYEFAIGMGPRLWTYWRKNGTDYTIRALPIGGFVNLKGMQPEDPATPDGVNGRRPAERALIYLGGPLMNMIFGTIVALTLGWMWGTLDPTVVLVGTIDKKTPATQMAVLEVNGAPPTGIKPGLRVGDRLVEVNGNPVKSLESLSDAVSTAPGKPVRVMVQRGKDRILLEGTPKLSKVPLDEALVVKAVPPGSTLPLEPGDQVDAIRYNGESLLKDVERTADLVPTAEAKLKEYAGKQVELKIWRRNEQKMVITTAAAPVDLEIRPTYRMQGRLGITQANGGGKRVSFKESVDMGVKLIFGMVEMYASLFSQVDRIGEKVTGPVGILGAMQSADKLPMVTYVMNLASLSFSLAIFNLFPIFVLDGGHMLLLTMEVVRRKRLEPRMQQAAQLFGLLIIAILFILITGKDLLKQFG